MRRLILLLACALLSVVTLSAQKKSKTVKVTVEPAEAAIYINNTFAGYGYAEFQRPKKNEVVIIRSECNEYSPVRRRRSNKWNISHSLVCCNTHSGGRAKPSVL